MQKTCTRSHHLSHSPPPNHKHKLANHVRSCAGKNDIQVVVQMVPILREACECLIEPCELQGVKGSPLPPAPGTSGSHVWGTGAWTRGSAGKLQCKNIWLVSLPVAAASFSLLSPGWRRHFYFLASLSSCNCKRASRRGPALMFLSPHSSQAGHQLEICVHLKCFILHFPPPPSILLLQSHPNCSMDLILRGLVRSNAE